MKGEPGPVGLERIAEGTDAVLAVSELLQDPDCAEGWRAQIAVTSQRREVCVAAIRGVPRGPKSGRCGEHLPLARSDARELLGPDQVNEGVPLVLLENDRVGILTDPDLAAVDDDLRAL